MAHALVLTYHAIEPGPPPLCIDSALFAAHVECIGESDATAVTVSQLADALRTGSLKRPLVAVTFDDGAASVARVAAPLLRARGVPATIFCVAGHIGGMNDWSTGRSGPSFRLARSEELIELADQGFEIGCHGMTHAPLREGLGVVLEDEIVAAQRLLEGEVGAPVRSFAYPYGATPAPSACARREVVHLRLLDRARVRPPSLGRLRIAALRRALRP